MDILNKIRPTPKIFLPESTSSIISTEVACTEATDEKRTIRAKTRRDHLAEKTMMEEVMEKTSFCVEKKSLLQCEGRMNKGLHIDDAFCLPLAERFCGGTEEIRIKTDGTQVPYGTYGKWFPDLCSHYEIVPTQTAAIEKLQEPGIGLGEKRKLGQAEREELNAQKRERKEQRKLRKAERKEKFKRKRAERQKRR